MAKITIRTIKEKKQKGEKIVALTAYDYPTAKILDSHGVDIILVGDSVGNVVLGYESTLPVTMEEMLHHTRAVKRGVKNALLVGDMPFLSYQPSIEEGIRNAGLLIKAGAEAVKIEGGRQFVSLIERLTQSGIPVMGHIGLTPQWIHSFGGYRIQGRTAKDALALIEDAILLEKAGIFSLVLEGVPMQVAKLITENLTIPTIGIGAGPYCDGQILVFHDLFGLGDFIPKHAKVMVDLKEVISQGVKRYIEEVKGGVFPTEKNTVLMDEAEEETLRKEWSKRKS
ncbi:3-methyl-2-oxobutanoate hydroxymethyltransferase [bacterium]|nr:3-methyl-2-oxobutanoate hydroxymethyltransferase [bacterium]